MRMHDCGVCYNLKPVSTARCVCSICYKHTHIHPHTSMQHETASGPRCLCCCSAACTFWSTMLRICRHAVKGGGACWTVTPPIAAAACGISRSALACLHTLNWLQPTSNTHAASDSNRVCGTTFAELTASCLICTATCWQGCMLSCTRHTHVLSAVHSSQMRLLERTAWLFVMELPSEPYVPVGQTSLSLFQGLYKPQGSAALKLPTLLLLNAC